MWIRELAGFGIALVLLAGATQGQQVLEDFEQPLSDNWQREDSAAHWKAHRAADLSVTGYRGRYLLDSFDGDDAKRGRLFREVSIDGDYLNFLIAGGNDSENLAVRLSLDGQIIKTATGRDSSELRWVSWDLRRWKNQTATLEIVDHATGEWGHLAVDQFEWSQQPRSGSGLWRLEEYRRSKDYYRESHRPGFHFTPELNWMNDPNGLVYHQGNYHLFYQYNPLGQEWGHMSWGHAVSRDLISWEHWPLAISEQSQEMAFSGSAVWDFENSSRLGAVGESPLVAIYTGHSPGRQTQNLAISRDGGIHWDRYQGNPVLDLGEADFRDPKVFWYAELEKWIMVVSLANQKVIQFYGSQDLKQWEHLSDFGPAGASGKPNWECPDLFPLKVLGTGDQQEEDAEVYWILEADMGSGSVAGGSGGEYFIGRFDGKVFQPIDQEVRWVDYGRDFYAPISWNQIPDSDGRRIWIGWMNNWETCLVPTYPWRSAMSIPRELSLRRVDGKLHLCQSPVQELSQHYGHTTQLPTTIVNGEISTGVRGKQFDIQLDWSRMQSQVCGIRVLRAGDEYTEIGYDRQRNCVYVDRTHSGRVDFHEAFPGRHEFPIEKRDSVSLRILIDQSSVEVFVDQGQGVITDLVFPGEGSDQMTLFTQGGAAQVVGEFRQVKSTMQTPVKPSWRTDAMGDR